MHQPDMQVGDSDTLRRWRLKLGLTQKELGELLGTHKLHIAGQENGRCSIRKATINHLALIYAINSLPQDAPVSIIQEMLVPPGVIYKRQKAMQCLKTKSQKRRQAPFNLGYAGIDAPENATCEQSEYSCE